MIIALQGAFLSRASWRHCLHNNLVYTGDAVIGSSWGVLSALVWVKAWQECNKDASLIVGCNNASSWLQQMTAEPGLSDQTPLRSTCCRHILRQDGPFVALKKLSISKSSTYSTLLLEL